MLERLAELGMVMAERLAATPEPTGDEALKFLRLAKAVRQTLALHAQMEAEVQAEAARIVEREAKDKRTERAQRQGRIVKAVEQLIESETGDDHDRCDEINERFYDWQLECEDDEEFGLDKPFGEAVAAICKMLGLTPDWTHYADEDWVLDIFAAQACRQEPAPIGQPSPDEPEVQRRPPSPS